MSGLFIETLDQSGTNSIVSYNVTSQHGNYIHVTTSTMDINLNVSSSIFTSCHSLISDNQRSIFSIIAHTTVDILISGNTLINNEGESLISINGGEVLDEFACPNDSMFIFLS